MSRHERSMAELYQRTYPGLKNKRDWSVWLILWLVWAFSVAYAFGAEHNTTQGWEHMPDYELWEEEQFVMRLRVCKYTQTFSLEYRMECYDTQTGDSEIFTDRELENI